MEVLLVRTSEITAFTPMGGNVDIDRYKPCILNVQNMVIEPILGKYLYAKIKTDFVNDDLAGDYLNLYESYLKPIIRHQAFAEYAEIGSYVVGNGGIFKFSQENTEVVSKDEAQYLAGTERSKAQFYIKRCEDWLKETNLPEYKRTSEKKVSTGWFL
jgi:hypothetical protein